MFAENLNVVVQLVSLFNFRFSLFVIKYLSYISYQSRVKIYPKL